MNNSPSKDDNKQNSFNIRPAAVKKWVEELPLGSTGESSKQLYHALKKVNHQTNSINHHLEFLEIITPTLNLLYPRLAKYFTDIALPIGSKTRNVLHITTALLSKILQGYHIVLKTLITKKPFGWKKPFALALHRSFIYSSHFLCTHRLSYQPYPQGTWREIFWCYQQAEKFNLLNKRFHNETTPEKTSIDYEFKKLLLLSLLSANELSQKHMQEVHNLMPLWIKNLEILTNEPKEKETCFTLNLLSDIPPYLIGTRNDNTQQKSDRYFLSTRNLKTVLTNYSTKIEDNGAMRVGKNILSKATILSLLTTWSRAHLRTEQRKQGTGFVDIITGLTAIHFVLNQQNQPAYDEVSTNLPDDVTDFESTLTIEPLNYLNKNDTLNLDHFLSSSEKGSDIWDKVYENSINEITPQSNWTESGIFKSYTFTKSILLDFSKGGYRLSVNDKKVDSLKHNELVAIREHALAPWALTQIKWLHFSEKGDVQFGLHVLTHHVLPVQVSYKSNKTLSKPLPCLLGIDRKKLMLFVPTLPTSLDGKQLHLEHQKQHSQLHLKNKILSTPAFDVYEILEPQSNNNKLAKNIIDTEHELNSVDNIWNNF